MQSPGPLPRSRWELVGRWLWFAVAGGIALRFLLASDPARNNVYLKVFAPAAQAFVDGAPLYAPTGGFRYPPLCAALLLPFAASGDVLGSILWRALNLLLLWLGVRAVFRAGWPQPLGSRERGVFLLLLLLATVVSLNNGQPNVLILGLALLATAGVLRGDAAAPAAAVTGGTVCKVYPLAYGLVLATLRPRLLAWLLPMTVLVVALPFLLQSPDYVQQQYRELFTLLRAEDRTDDLANAYRDLRLLAAAAGWTMPEVLFRVLQVTGGLAIVAVCWSLRRRAVAMARVLEYAFSLTMCYFMLLGPATEKATYALLGPTLAWPLLVAWRQRDRGALLLWGAANLLVVLGHVAEPHDRAVQAAHPWLRCFLPAAALLATVALAWRAVADLRRPPA
jgi:hypothetical protein